MKQTICEFQSGNLCCRGWFYQPDGEPPYACVVMAHGFGAAPDGPLGEIARRFAGAGIAAFAFDFRNFGVSDGDPRLVVNIQRQLEDWHAAISYVRDHADVDSELVGLWGSSLTGGEVLAVAARDHRVAGVVAQVPYADGFSLARAAGLRHHLRTLPAIAHDLVRAATRRPPYMIDALGPPGRPAAVRTADHYETVVSRAPSWPNRVAARSVPQIYGFRPIRISQAIRSPLLVVLTYRDRVAPSDVALAAAQGLPYVELALFPARHFDLYSGATYERAVETEIRFLVHHFDRRKSGLALTSARTPATPAT